MIRENIEKIRKDIGGRARLILISKTVDEPRIREAYEAGIRDFGENKVQELMQKKPNLPSDIRWHFVGHLQTNKVKEVVGQAVLIHSVDSIHLAKEIEKASAKLNLITDILIQVNTSGEASKFGLKPDGLEDVVGEMTRFSHLRIKGLMTVGPLSRDESKIRDSFKMLSDLQKKMKIHYPDLDWSELSMGMSEDYPVAIEEGSTMVRVGRAVFGERK